MAAGRILIVDGIVTNRVVLKVKLDAAFHLTLTAADGATCLHLAQTEQPDLILLDQALPDLPGLEVLHRLRADPRPDPRAGTVPVVLLADAPQDALRRAALQAGAVDVLDKRVDDQLLLARIRNLLRQRSEVQDNDLPQIWPQIWPQIRPQIRPPIPAKDQNQHQSVTGLAEPGAAYAAPGRVALVFQRAETALALRRALAGVLPDQVLTLRRDGVLGGDGVGGLPPDVFVLDAGLLPGGGLRLLSELRSRGETRHAGVCLWQGDSPCADTAAQAYDLGADAVFTAAMSAQEVALRLAGVMARRREGRRLRGLLQDAARLAAVDDLTGLWNRRYALPQLAAMAAAAQARAQGLAVMVLDIDRFKSVNDRFGHSTGNAVLVAVAQRLRDILGSGILGSGILGSGNLGSGAGDAPLIARIGGEEFLVALPCPTAQEARRRAEALCDGIRTHAVTLEEMPPISVTISVGLAMLAGQEPVTDALERADRALLGAKERGRDRVTLARNVA